MLRLTGVACSVVVMAGLAVQGCQAGQNPATRNRAALRLAAAGPLADWNGDGNITVCITGDSTMGDPLLGNTLATTIPQADNVLGCAQSGTTTADLLDSIDKILNGSATSPFPCTATKGRTGTLCDYVIYHIGVNDFHAQSPLPKLGVCYDNNGLNQGDPCTCDLVFSGIAPPPSYCRDGSINRQPCTDARDCSLCVGGANDGNPCSPRCAGGADAGQRCASNNDCPSSGCVLDYDCPGRGQCKWINALQCAGGTHAGWECAADSDCPSSACSVFNSSLACTQTTPQSLCQPGCLHTSGCPNGLCLELPSTASQQARQTAIMDAIDAHVSHARVVLVTPAPTLGGIGCWGAVNQNQLNDETLYLNQAAQRYYNTVNLRNEFAAHCIMEICASCAGYCYHDGVHYNNQTNGGIAVLASAITHCLTGVRSDPDVDCTHLAPEPTATATPTF